MVASPGSPVAGHLLPVSCHEGRRRSDKSAERPRPPHTMSFRNRLQLLCLRWPACPRASGARAAGGGSGAARRLGGRSLDLTRASGRGTSGPQPGSRWACLLHSLGEAARPSRCARRRGFGRSGTLSDELAEKVEQVEHWRGELEDVTRRVADALRPASIPTAPTWPSARPSRCAGPRRDGRCRSTPRRCARPESATRRGPSATS